MTLRARRPGLRWLTHVVVVLSGVSLLSWTITRATAEAEWYSDDRAALVSSALLGYLFLVLAKRLERDADRRAEAVANAELITSIGALHMSAARSLAGSEEHALRVAADARAALQHYVYASGDQQRMLLRTIENAYSDLLFATFCRADVLPRSIWLQLADGARLLEKNARAVVATLDPKARGEARRRALTEMADHVQFAEDLGERVRGLHSSTGCILDSQEDPSSVERLLGHLERLYRTELTVVHDWQVLHRNADRLRVSVHIDNIDAAEHWYSPWYVARRRGLIKPVNVLGTELEEAAKLDEIVDAPNVPEHPTALRHGEIPEGMRTRSIARITDAINRHHHVTVCVLGYDVQTDDGVKRIVLDGNHRIAAARRVQLRRISEGHDDITSSVRVMTFLVSECEPVEDLVHGGSPNPDDTKTFPGWRWSGFTPDIGCMRGVVPTYDPLEAGRGPHAPGPARA